MEAKDWISTKDRLPEINNVNHCSDEVLICLNGNEVVTGYFFSIIDYSGNTYWASSIGNYKYPTGLVTHWMKIVLPQTE